MGYLLGMNRVIRIPLFVERLLCVGACFASAFVADQAVAAYVSEIDFASPAGRGIELSNVDPASDYTLLFMSASPSSSLFGLVLDTLKVPAGTGRAGVAMVTDSSWPGQSTLTAPLADVPLVSADPTLPLAGDVLLVVLAGRSDVVRFNNPVTDPLAASRYDRAAVTDWLVLNTVDQSGAYASALDVATVNAALGIDLLSRRVDANAGRVLGRTSAPGQLIDMDTFYAGDPDPTSMQFEIPGSTLVYTYTPGMSNLPLIERVPEPGALSIFAAAGAICMRRRRP
jgi:hypothetical protein